MYLVGVGKEVSPSRVNPHWQWIGSSHPAFLHEIKILVRPQPTDPADQMDQSAGLFILKNKFNFKINIFFLLKKQSITLNLSLVIKECPLVRRVTFQIISAYFIIPACTCISFICVLLCSSFSRVLLEFHFEINSAGYGDARLQTWEVTSPSLSCIYLR